MRSSKRNPRKSTDNIHFELPENLLNLFAERYVQGYNVKQQFLTEIYNRFPPYLRGLYVALPLLAFFIFRRDFLSFESFTPPSAPLIALLLLWGKRKQQNKLNFPALLAEIIRPFTDFLILYKNINFMMSNIFLFFEKFPLISDNFSFFEALSLVENLNHHRVRLSFWLLQAKLKWHYLGHWRYKKIARKCFQLLETRSWALWDLLESISPA